MIIVVSLFGTVQIYAMDNDEQSDTFISRSDMIYVLKEENIDVPKDAYIGLVEYNITENETILVVSVIQTHGDRVEQGFLIPFDENNDPIDFNKQTLTSRGASSGSISSVYVTGYYISTTDSAGTVTIYRPYKVAFSSSLSQNVFVQYDISGVKFDLNRDNTYSTGSHRITCSAYPATINLQYDTTYYYSGYIGPGSSECRLNHRISVTVNGNYKGFVKCAGHGSCV